MTTNIASRNSMVHASIITMASVLLLSSAAFAQDRSKFGTADHAKATLLKVVAAVTADKAGALDMFNKGEGGFLDLHPFCANASDGSIIALNKSNARQWIGQDIRTLKDPSGKPFGQAQFAAAQKPEGQLTEVRYLVPNSGAHTTPVPKVSFTTKAGDVVCGVEYYPITLWTFENAGG